MRKSRSVLRKWIKCYKSHREQKGNGKGMSYFMTKGRSTTLKERIKNVIFCVDNNHDYQYAAKKPLKYPINIYIIRLRNNLKKKMP